MNHPKIWTRDFVAICLSSFFIFLNFYMLATTLPQYVSERLSASGQQMGLVITIYVLAAVIMRPFAGQWVDRYGKNATVVALALFFASTLLYPAIHSLLLLLVLRAIHGGSYGMSSTMTGAMASELIPAQRKGEGIGYFSMFMSLAMVIGPFLGLTLVHQTSYTVLFMVCIGLTAFSLLFGFLTKEAPKEAAIRNKPAGRLSWSMIIEVKALPVSLAGFVLAFSYSSLTSFISVYAKEINLTQVASYFFIFFAVMIVLPRPLIGKIFDRYGEHVLAYPGIALFIIGMLVLASAHSPVVFLISGAIIGLGHGAIIPCFQTLALRAAPSGRTGLATGTFFLMFDLGYGIGSYVLGVIAQHTHYVTMYRIAGLLVILSGVVYYVLHHRMQGRSTIGKAV